MLLCYYLQKCHRSCLNKLSIVTTSLTKTLSSSGVATGGGDWGAITIPLCQYAARDFLKIDEKIGVGRGSSKSSEVKRV